MFNLWKRLAGIGLMIMVMATSGWGACATGTSTGTWTTSTSTYSLNNQVVKSSPPDYYTITVVSSGTLNLSVINKDNAQSLTATLYPDSSCTLSSIWNATANKGNTISTSVAVAPGTYKLYIAGSNANNNTDYSVSGKFGGPYLNDNPRPFEIIYQSNLNGNLKIIGNSILCEKDALTGTCKASVDADNNDLNTLFFKLPSDSADATITNSTSYTFALPAGVNKSDVVWAGLYWQAGIKGTPTETQIANAKKVKLKAPGDVSYRDLTAETVNGAHSNRFNWMNNTVMNDALYYQGVREITDIVKSAGAGTYQVANIEATSGDAYTPGHFGGWAIAVVYNDANEMLKNITVYDGFGAVNQDQNVTATLAGFLTPLSGTVDSTFMIFGSEGDRKNYLKDRISITDSGTIPHYLKSDGTATTTAGNYNPMNSSITQTGSDSRVPSYDNVIGIDIDTYNVGTGAGGLGIIGNGQTSTTITLSTGDDVYNPGVFAFATDIYQPFISIDKSASTTGTLSAGQEIVYMANIQNTGRENASNIVVYDNFDQNILTRTDGTATNPAVTLGDLLNRDAAAIESSITCNYGLGNTDCACTVTPSPLKISCGIPSLAVQETAHIEFRVSIAATPNTQGQDVEVENKMYASYYNALTWELVPESYSNPANAGQYLVPPPIVIPTVSISPTTLSTTEGNSGITNAVYTVTLSAAPSSNVAIGYSVTGSGTNAATSGTDFNATSGTLMFAAGTTMLSQTINVPIIGDTTVESNETYTVTLSNPVNATLLASTATGTIINDDVPALSLSPATLSTIEGNSGTTNAVYTVTLSSSSASAVSVQYTVAGSGTNAATSGSDFSATSGTLTFAAGTTTLSQTINVSIIGDTAVESNETYTVTLSNATNATISAATATGTITNDDEVTNPTIPILEECGVFPSAISTREQINTGTGGSGIFVWNVDNVNADQTSTILQCSLASPSDIPGGGPGGSTSSITNCAVDAPPPVLTLPAFLPITNESNTTVNGTLTIPAAGSTDTVNVGGFKLTMNSNLTFQATHSYDNDPRPYMVISSINAEQNANRATVEFTEGDYWIGGWNHPANDFEIKISGKVRLFVRDGINFNTNELKINTGTTTMPGVASNLVIFSYNDVNFSNNGSANYDVKAFWYTKGQVNINGNANSGGLRFTGGFTAEKDITIGNNQDFVYPAGNLPDGFGECNLAYTFQTGLFDAVDLCVAHNDTCLDDKIKTKIVNNPFSLTALSLNLARTALQLRNPTVTVDASLAKMNGTSYEIVKSLGNVSFTSSAAAIDIGSITHDKAARDIRVLFRFCKDASGGIYSWNGGSCSTGQTKDYALSSDNFAIRPNQFTIDGVTNPGLLTAGGTHAMTLYANPFGGAATSVTADYTQTSANLTLNTTKLMKDGTINNGLAGTSSFPTAFTITDGLSIGANMTFSDVGRITFNIEDTDWAMVDYADGSTLDQRAIRGAGNYTYIPFQFSVANVQIFDTNNTAFTYLSNDLNMSSKLDFVVTAQNMQGLATANFDSGANLYENPLSITPSIIDAVGGIADATPINNSLIGGFMAGVAHVMWDDVNTSRLMRFNFTRPAAPINPIEIVPAEVNLTVSSTYTDGGATVTVANSAANKDGATNGTAGNAVFLYGRADAPDYRFNTVSGCGRIYFEFYNTIANNPIVTGIFAGKMPPLSLSPDRNWYQNTDHNTSLHGSVSTFTVSNVTSTTTGCLGTAGLGTQKSGFVYNGTQGYPYRATVTLDASDWLDMPNNNFGLEYRQVGAWIGVKSGSNQATDQNAELNSNRRIMW